MPAHDNSKAYNEWILQSDYDYETAEAMFSTARYVHAVFMCHLSIEKVIKSQYVKRLNKVAPKSHNLVWLAEEIKMEFPEKLLPVCVSTERCIFTYALPTGISLFN